MTLDNKLLTMPIAVAARKRAETGGTVFTWRLLTNATKKVDLADVSDAVESVEHYGWRLEHVLPEGQASTLQAAWFLMFRRAG